MSKIVALGLLLGVFASAIANTVKTLLQHVYAKTGARNRVHLRTIMDAAQVAGPQQ